MSLAHPFVYIARLEAQTLLRSPRMWVAALVVSVLPLIYALIYLSSVWDPVAHTQSLSVALVNLDEGFFNEDTLIKVGSQVVDNLKHSNRFTYTELQDAESARQSVRQGHYAFALIIPPDFSSHAIPGVIPGDGKLVVYSSDGNHYQTALLARQFATELGHAVNERLNEQRWSLVLQSAAGSQHSVDQLHRAVEELRNGAYEIHTGSQQAEQAAQQLANGSNRLNIGVNALTDGMRQMGNGIRTMDSKRPRTSELNRLRNGAEKLVAGHTELGAGLDKIHKGAGDIQRGVQGYQATLEDSLLAPNSLKDGVSQLKTALTELHNGIGNAQEGQRQLADGAEKLSTGVGSLTTGMQAMSNGIHTIATKLPEDNQLDELNAGSGKIVQGNSDLANGLHKLEGGTRRLSDGLDTLFHALPANVSKPSGSPEGMANSVQPVMEVAAPVPNSGHGIAPNLLPAALWLGASIAVFLINLHILPRPAHRSPRPYLLLGKLSMPAVLVLLQSVLLYAAVENVLNLRVAHQGPFIATLVITGWSFLCIVSMLAKLFGDAGKALSMVLLAVQISASGGVMPVELSGGWYASISPWLPLTWVARGIKASVFDAFDGQWGMPLAINICWGLAALLVTMYLGRWKFVSPRAMRPGVDI
ncbi:YhgE/Pip domain-containing protein [Curvibacter sp. CHRR-16]|uniref:YhgE/Pip domain-containing protein n=1 Tax=Curvibacter sp. CHRR-16 TaxID=2835872 RepID=UPI001BDACF1B|nr:YhgE/Pip domain-containing protein [Curvibacter sp. CHRR-16]MBT0569601.1 YhgE/Pip domain-containing protein [Curvibacter sp. CHRR-16]